MNILYEYKYGTLKEFITVYINVSNSFYVHLNSHETSIATHVWLELYNKTQRRNIKFCMM